MDDNMMFSHLWPVPIEYEEHDPREVLLKLDTDSVELHLVKGVQIATDTHRVGRHRIERAVPMPDPGDTVPIEI